MYLCIQYLFSRILCIYVFDIWFTHFLCALIVAHFEHWYLHIQGGAGASSVSLEKWPSSNWRHTSKRT